MKKKRKLKKGRLVLICCVMGTIAFFVIRGFCALIDGSVFSKNDDTERYITDDYNEIKAHTVSASLPHAAPVTLKYDDAGLFDSEILSEYCILIESESGRVIASRNSKAVMYPASMTKIMSLIVAVENIDNVSDTFTMTYEIINPLVEQGATRTGLESGETVPLIDLLYGVILPSGADATIALAQYVSGSEEEFVKLMNAKAQELGLINTHFTNTSGLHDRNHYTTAHDMAIILDYAMKIPLASEILSSQTYTTSSTEQHPGGLEMTSTMFGKISPNYIDGVTIVGGKTGYTAQSKHCLASVAVKNGKTYIAVTAMGETKYTPVYDIIKIYDEYI